MLPPDAIGALPLKLIGSTALLIVRGAGIIGVQDDIFRKGGFDVYTFRKGGFDVYTKGTL
jgi:hypothetical protein